MTGAENAFDGVLAPMEIFDLNEVEYCIPTLAAWHHAEWSHLYPGDTLGKRIQRMQEYLTMEAVPRTFVGIEDGQPLGSGAIIPNDMETRKDLTPWLASVYVDEAYRRRGLGAQLVRRVMEHARTSGIQDLYLFTPDQAPFYAGLGWQILSTEEYLGEHVTVMHARL